MDTNGKILWVEDHPDWILQNITYFLPDKSKALDNLLEKVDWAFDIHDALELLSENKYSLHILDADLPRKMPEERKEIFRKAIKNGNNPSADYGFYNALKATGDGYVLVYNKTRENVVLLSSSRVAPITAFALKIPFYSKYAELTGLEDFVNKNAYPTGTFNPPDVENIIADIRRERYNNDRAAFEFSNEELMKMDEWEHGDLRNFVKKYIMEQ